MTTMQSAFGAFPADADVELEGDASAWAIFSRRSTGAGGARSTCAERWCVMPVDLDELERLLAEGTPGPWRVRYSNGGGDQRCGLIVARETAHRDREVLDVGEVGDQRMENDLDAIAALRNAAPALLADLRACRAEREKAEAERWEVIVAWRDAQRELGAALAERDALRAGLVEALLMLWREEWSDADVERLRGLAGPGAPFLCSRGHGPPHYGRCSNCGCLPQAHDVDDEERRACSECECKQYQAPPRALAGGGK